MKSLRILCAALAAAFLAFGAVAEQRFERFEWENNENVDVQIANPGVGANASQYGLYENHFVYANDGDGFLGPNARPDITLSTNSFWQFYREHELIRYNQPEHDAWHPERRVSWWPLCTGSFDIVKSSGGGVLLLNTGNTAGCGGQIMTDYQPFQLVPGQMTGWMFYLGRNGYQFIELGWKYNENNKVIVQRSDFNGNQATWSCQSIVAGAYGFSQSTGVTTGVDRRQIVFYYRQSPLQLEVYIGNANNTAVRVCVIPAGGLPNSGNLYTTFLKYTLQGASTANGTLYNTTLYNNFLE